MPASGQQLVGDAPPDGPLPPERPYAFRRRLAEVHAPGRRDPDAAPDGTETVLDPGWSVVVGAAGAPPLLTAAKDLQDYLLTSMGLSLRLLRVADPAAAARGATAWSAPRSGWSSAAPTPVAPSRAASTWRT